MAMAYCPSAESGPREFEGNGAVWAGTLVRHSDSGPMIRRSGISVLGSPYVPVTRILARSQNAYSSERRVYVDEKLS